MKRLFIIGICLCLSGMVSAQWHVGCEVGANWSTVKFPSYEMGGKRMTGFNIGAVGMYRWSERWGLQANLMYTTRGYNVSDGVIIPGDEIIKDRVEDVAVESKYIDIPVVAKFYPGLGVHLDAGMQVGFLVGRTLKYGNSRQPFRREAAGRCRACVRGRMGIPQWGERRLALYVGTEFLL